MDKGYIYIYIYIYIYLVKKETFNLFTTGQL